MKYKVEILETLSDIVKIDAKDEEDAIKKVEKMYYNQDVVLGADNFDNDVVFKLLNDEE